jgi:hypothetical protein
MGTTGSAAGQAPLRQSAGAVLMVRPKAFGWNPETAGSNAFQRPDGGAAGTDRVRALTEFEALVGALGSAGVGVFALDEPGPSACPDAVFPNNWVSLHHDGTVVLYPMLAPSRRIERRMELISGLEERGGYGVSRLLDLTHHELSGRFLEGTGSVVFDHAARVAYACRSPRTDESVLRELCEELDYEPAAFDAADAGGVPVYHTNVLLSIGRRNVIVCAESVPATQRAALLERLRASGRSVLEVSHGQMTAFACNVLELEASDGAAVLAMSARAHDSLGRRALDELRESVQRIVSVPIPTIEQRGGGSVRCMLAEVFLPRAKG